MGTFLLNSNSEPDQVSKLCFFNGILPGSQQQRFKFWQIYLPVQRELIIGRQVEIEAIEKGAGRAGAHFIKREEENRTPVVVGLHQGYGTSAAAAVQHRR